MCRLLRKIVPWWQVAHAYGIPNQHAVLKDPNQHHLTKRSFFKDPSTFNCILLFENNLSICMNLRIGQVLKRFFTRLTNVRHIEDHGPFYEEWQQSTQGQAQTSQAQVPTSIDAEGL